MKEIDKIRIRQWNQDNPYIQMKNLENAQPGYRVLKCYNKVVTEVANKI